MQRMGTVGDVEDSVVSAAGDSDGGGPCLKVLEMLGGTYGREREQVV